MRADLPERLSTVGTDPVARLLADLPPQWQGEVLGPGIDGWAARIDSGRHRRLNMTGVPERLRVELAWMAHWQYRDGAHVGVTGYRLIAVVLAWAAQNHWRIPESLATVDPAELTRLFARCFQARNGRLPAADGYNRMTTVLGYPRLALMARLNDGPWWALDTWHPRCDPRIPQREREPLGYEGCSPGRAQIPWLREASKWHLATLLESGTLAWSTIVGIRVLSLTRFDRWLTTLDEPTAVLRDADRAGAQAAAFRQWASEPDNRSASRTNKSSKAAPRQINKDLLAVAELMRLSPTIHPHRPEQPRIASLSGYLEQAEFGLADLLGPPTRRNRRSRC
ncbi:hypothetical protein ACQEVF_50050 [Nonomuraea polychroma]|uniref:hypothetical protein n=1 Tax=Nonomuraea polychroma TaxID=46176 RepID=UPI003D926C78